jgi:hypothetical protein
MPRKRGKKPVPKKPVPPKPVPAEPVRPEPVLIQEDGRLGGPGARPVVHETIPVESEFFIRRTYDNFGRYLQPTFEQWEREFMRVPDHVGTLTRLIKLSFALTAFHMKRGSPIGSHAEERRLASNLSLVATGYRPRGCTPQDEELMKETCRFVGLY